eukprot:6188307-Pleurochrysis_carterae.AAC.1
MLAIARAVTQEVEVEPHDRTLGVPTLGRPLYYPHAPEHVQYNVIYHTLQRSTRSAKAVNSAIRCIQERVSQTTN